MKIYFAGSIRGGRDDKDIYFSIIKELQKYGQVLTEHIGDPNLTARGEEIDVEQIFRRDMDWVKECDLVVAEVTNPSLGVGYEIGQAESFGKKILCLYREVEGKRISAMVLGNTYLQIQLYKDMEGLSSFLEDFFKK